MSTLPCNLSVDISVSLWALTLSHYKGYHFIIFPYTQSIDGTARIGFTLHILLGDSLHETEISYNLNSHSTMYLYPKMGPSIMVHLLPYSSLGNIYKLTSGTLAIRRSPKRFTVGSPTSRFANVLFANFWSRFAYVLGLFLNCFYLISGWKNEVYTFV